MKLISYLLILTLLAAPGAVTADDKANDELYFAASAFDAPGAKAALTRGADANFSRNNRSVLSWAAQSGSADVVQTLIDAHARLNDQDGIGHTPLMRAVDLGHIDVVKVLLKAKADPDIKTEDGTTALILAVKYSTIKPEIVQGLLDAGADPNAKTRDGETAASIAVQEQKRELIPILARYKVDWNLSGPAHTPLGSAVDQGDTDSVQALLVAGADPNAKGETGRAPLVMAIDNEEIFRILLAAKADPNTMNSWGQTVLMQAILEDKPARVEDLIKAGADLSVRSENDQTALELAETQAKYEMVELLKRHGAK